MSDNEVMRIYERLSALYGPQGWWPVTPEGGEAPVYGTPVRTRTQRFEVVLGVILTQNTAWTNASRAISELYRHGLVDPDRLDALSAEAIAPVIRSAGYFNQKAKKIKAYLAFKGGPTREELLDVWGLGPESVDSILLYACGVPLFVVDAYTRRFSLHRGLISERDTYGDVQAIFTRGVDDYLSAQSLSPGDLQAAKRYIFNEYHALIVAHGKRYYSRKPFGIGDPIEAPPSPIFAK